MLQSGLFRSCRPLKLSYPEARELAIQGYLDVQKTPADCDA
jgi:hypothetical protein